MTEENAQPQAENTVVRVEFEDGSAAIDIEIDALTWEDMELLESSRTDPDQMLSYEAILSIMRRLSPTGYKKLSVRRDTKRFFTAIGKAMQQASDPNA